MHHRSVHPSHNQRRSTAQIAIIALICVLVVLLVENIRRLSLYPRRLKFHLFMHVTARCHAKTSSPVFRTGSNICSRSLRPSVLCLGRGHRQPLGLAYSLAEGGSAAGTSGNVGCPPEGQCLDALILFHEDDTAMLIE